MKIALLIGILDLKYFFLGSSDNSDVGLTAGSGKLNLLLPLVELDEELLWNLNGGDVLEDFCASTGVERVDFNGCVYGEGLAEWITTVLGDIG